MTDKEFLENVYEIAFGDNAINKEYSHEEVLTKIILQKIGSCRHVAKQGTCDCKIDYCATYQLAL